MCQFFPSDLDTYDKETRGMARETKSIYEKKDSGFFSTQYKVWPMLLIGLGEKPCQGYHYLVLRRTGRFSALYAEKGRESNTGKIELDLFLKFLI